tara:strand:- start:49 stop:279 length:231 start_codon:yes stop_codon:yes gene_type:complete
MTRNDQLWASIETAARDLIALPFNSQQERGAGIELEALCKAYAIIEHGTEDLVPEFTALYRNQALNWAEKSTRSAA